MLKSQPMNRPTRPAFIWLISLIAVALAGAAPPQGPKAQSDAKQDDKSIKPEAIQGCYELTLSPWFPEMRLGEDEEFIVPPARIQLFADKGTAGREANGYLVRAAPGVKPSVHTKTYWVPKGTKSLAIVFSTGLSGLTMELKTSDAETLHGKASTFWDFNRRKQTAEVTAHRVPCGKP